MQIVCFSPSRLLQNSYSCLFFILCVTCSDSTYIQGAFASWERQPGTVKQLRWSIAKLLVLSLQQRKLYLHSLLFKVKASFSIQLAHLHTTLHMAGGIYPTLVTMLGFELPKPNGTGQLHPSCCCSWDDLSLCPYVLHLGSPACGTDGPIQAWTSVSHQVCIGGWGNLLERELWPWVTLPVQPCPGCSLPPTPKVLFSSEWTPSPLSEMGLILSWFWLG